MIRGMATGYPVLRSAPTGGRVVREGAAFRFVPSSSAG
jgi:hypothetical protein